VASPTCIDCVVHRDIAARNVLLTGHDTAKVADFGMARVVDGDDDQETAKTIGPIKWMAPEQIVRRSYSTASDVFAFGVLLFEIFKQEEPWKGESHIVVATKVMAGERMAVSSNKKETQRAQRQRRWTSS
jgi:serine/threonine protein kinase